MTDKKVKNKRSRAENMPRRNWSKLDNAAKVFPSTSNKSDTRVFRFSCQLNEDIDPAALQSTLNGAVKEFPHFLCVLRRGLFWYYLEQSDEAPVVTEENETPCHEIYINGQRNLLFNVTYYRKRINLEIFHALTDGTGALYFLQYIVWHYLYKKHKDDFDGEFPPLEDTSSALQKANDSFVKYYSKDEKNHKEKKQEQKKKSAVKIRKAYTLKGERRGDDDLLVIEARMSVSKILEAAHKYGTTLTGLLTSLYISAIEKEMNMQSRELPVVIGIPVNLRRYFPSETSRNFFYMTNVYHTAGKDGGSLEEIAAAVTEQMKESLVLDNMKNGLNSYGELARNVAIRLAPLPIKDVAIRIARYFSDKKGTSVVSNIGAVNMPEPLEEYIESFTIFCSSCVTQLTLCSYKDCLSLGFSSAFVNNEVVKNFVRLITEMGIDVTICCNDFNADTEGKDAVL